MLVAAAGPANSALNRTWTRAARVAGLYFTVCGSTPVSLEPLAALYMVNKRKKRLEGEIGVFIRKYARKRYPGMDPNDRRYDREIEQLIRRMKPEELDELLRAGDEDLSGESNDGG
jgi:hypothetical protein